MMLRRLAAGIAAAFLVLTGTAVPAAADTVTIRWVCIAIPAPPSATDYRVTITAPATASVGQTVTVTAAVESVLPNGGDIEAGTIRATMTVELGGAASGQMTIPGLTNPEIQRGTPWRIGGGAGQVTLTNPGEVTFHPMHIATTAGWRCGRFAPPYPVAATTRVS